MVEHIEKEEKETNAHTTPTQRNTPEVSTNTPKFPRILPKFPRIPPKFRKYHDCTLQVSHVHRCQVSARPNLYPEVSQYAKLQGFWLSKTTLQVSRCLPKRQTDTLQFLNLQNHLSRSQKVTKRHPEFLYTHEVREFLTIQRPQCTRPNTPPRSLSGYLIAFKIRTFQGEILHLGGSTSHRPRHR